ncbi:prephenate dehydratase PHA2 [Lachancea thermotolerans CBS 6340]|uniref:prephenate dehydratase n=1 Tax=Lachancea thermotolerans (strain ATCC 56472 / CBS 6340 / NRRL Y-8284) TaxID=559295 RepID=C5DJU5_LACTC|nr:KLTH0F19206p [Lachancea thermotolerans CBS 6340]CAR24584.1 KLTH0F19206p [Lachancea thermotolerans CBS 6340]
MVNIAFLGPLGTYTHQAALQQFPDKDANYIPLAGIPQCFEALIKDASLDFAVVPLENSTNGQVVFTYDLLRDLMNNCKEYKGNEAIPELEVVAEQYVSIELCLIAAQPMSLDDLNSETRVTIHSHPQVWGQASSYLKNLGQRVQELKTVDSSSTSGAVKICCEAGQPSGNEVVLAIASRTAATVNGAAIVDSPINDRKGNTTRFLTLRRRSTDFPPIPARPPVAKGVEQVALLTFIGKQDTSPGSLVDVLNVLKDHEINMCSISSRPYHHPDSSSKADESAHRKWQYIFFIEFNHADGVSWDQVVHEMGSKTLKFCFWGTFYRNGRYYETST